MGFKEPRRGNATFVFEDGPYEGAEVTMSLDLSIREILQIKRLADEEKAEDLFTAFGKHLISWNLEGEDGKPRPANAEGVLDCGVAFIRAIITRWTAEVSEVPAPLDGASSNGSGLREGSIPMADL